MARAAHERLGRPAQAAALGRRVAASPARLDEPRGNDVKALIDDLRLAAVRMEEVRRQLSFVP
jgi:hypothetical protein